MIQAAFEAGAAYMASMMAPQEDRISQEEAYRQFGAAWVRRMVDEGKASFVRGGKTANATKWYSRAELIRARSEQQIIKNYVKLKYIEK